MYANEMGAKNAGCCSKGTGCFTFLKVVLIIFNFIALLVGGLVLGLSIYSLVAGFGAQEMTFLLGSDIYQAGAILLIVIGSITILIAFFGGVGAAIENRCMLGFYFAVLLVLVCAFIASLVLGWVFRSKITEELEQKARNSLVNDYGFNSDTTALWDSVQQDLKCCGFSGDMNHNLSWAIYKMESKLFKNSKDGDQRVPYSCCDPTSDLEFCVGKNKTLMYIPRMDPPVYTIYTNNTALYKWGCKEKLEDKLAHYAYVIGGVSIAALCVMLIGLVFSLCMCIQLGKKSWDYKM